MLKIELRTYLVETIVSSVGIAAFVAAADYGHWKKSLALHVIAGVGCYVELCTRDGAYVYDMATFGSERIRSRGRATLDFDGIDEASGPPDVEAYLTKHGLAYRRASQDVIETGIRRIVFEERRIVAIDSLTVARSEGAAAGRRLRDFS